MRNKLIRLLVLPIIVLIFLIGWLMVVVGSDKEQKTQKAKTVQEKESITIIPILPEEIEQEA
jgi:cell division protein FtsI/penicillin-binding protein 2